MRATTASDATRERGTQGRRGPMTPGTSFIGRESETAQIERFLEPAALEPFAPEPSVPGTMAQR
ncbi:MAG: hypothetical protein ABSE77_19655 [Acidimicrobiales bacterium]